MNRKIIIALGCLPAVIILFTNVWMHTSWWPASFARITDTWTPHGPELVWSDLSPSDRTLPIELISSEKIRVRAVIASPVYLLFQPRRHSQFITVELTARQRSGSATTTAVIGYRRGNGPDGNLFVKTDLISDDGEWLRWTAKLPFSEMTKERRDARRIVFSFLENTEWDVRSVFLIYHDK